MNRITNSIIKKLKLPEPNSHKGDNGRLLIIAGSEKYHGSLLYAIKAASKIVDLIYVLTTKENQKLISRLKEKTAEFISYSLSEVEGALRQAKFDPSTGSGSKILPFDCILIGPGMGVNQRTRNLVAKVLKSGARAVLDADALKVLPNTLRNRLRNNHILTPHHGEFRQAFELAPTAANVKKIAKQYGCTIVLKGPVDYVAVPGESVMVNHTGNEGMTKGGTGDVLAGLIAAFFCLPTGDPPKGDKNDAYIAAAAGAYLNGKAGDELRRKVGPFYNAEDLAEQMPKTLWKLLNE